MADVCVRIAPSPTGAPHVGTAYIALFNIAYARAQGGKVILRIEDTDQPRSRHHHEDRLLSALKWLGLAWDEGPDVGGPAAPYRQSERLDQYEKYALQLVEAGHAYYSCTTPEELAAWRSRRGQGDPPPYYAERERSASQNRGRAETADSYVIRMKMPREGTAVVTDSLRGEIPFEYATIDDQIILKSDGFPTYHLAVVVDDHLMDVDNVIRGEEWISSTPKHLLLYQQLGWDPPRYTHLPLLLNPDRSKMSKRRNPTSIDYYRRAGFLPAPMLNYLALMAYPPDGEEEKFSFQQLVDRFDLGRVNLGGSVFDLDNLSWLNGRYIREDLTPEALLGEMKSWLLNDEFISGMLPLMQERMPTLGDFMPRCAFFFAREVNPSLEDLVPGKREAADAVVMLQTAVWALEELDPWSRTEIEKAVKRVADFWEWPIRDVTRPMFSAIMGQPVGPPLYESIVLLQVDMSRSRLLAAMALLGGLSKKKLKALEKKWR